MYDKENKNEREKMIRLEHYQNLTNATSNKNLTILWLW